MRNSMREVGGEPAVVLGHGALDLDRAGQRFDGAGEFDQQVVAAAAHDAAVVPLDRRIGDLRAHLAQPQVRAGLVALHHRAVAGDVGEHHGRQAAARSGRLGGR